MTFLLPRSNFVLALGVFVTLPSAIYIAAQSTTTPSAAVSITRVPQLARHAFPGDFNRDSRTDLIAGGQTSSGSPSLVLAVGIGNGTFATPRALGIAAEPFAVSDINADGPQDVIVRTSSGVSVLPGHGDGTFGTLRPVGAGSAIMEFFALAADFNGDSHRDVVFPATDVAGNPGLAIYPGHGDFTFGPHMFLPVTDPTSAISGDFNGDGRRDLAATTVCCSLWVFINNGGLLFSASEIVMNRDLADITTGDLNSDSRLDLVVGESFPSVGVSNPAFVAVLLGNGDGTFDPKVEYDAGVNGEFTVVVGDFTRDGILDVATGNQSAYYDDDFGDQMWDSISILKGTGTGGLTAPVTFALGNVNGERTYRFRQHQLNTNDLDADGHTDLISSPGAILLNRPPVVNRTPAVFAGPDRSYPTDDPIILSGEASDPDMHWLDYTWTNESGRLVGTAPMVAPVGLVWGARPGTYTYTLTVDDGQGGVATDSVVITVPDSWRGWVRLRNPTDGERVVVDRPYTVRWEASFESTITRFDLSYSINGGRTFQAIGECSQLAGSVRQCVWQRPGPQSADALLRIVATYDGSSQWIAISRPFALVDGGGALPPGWSNRDVGAVGAAGTATFDGTTFSVTGSGADIWGSADEFHYAFTSLSGDFGIVVRVTTVENVNQWTKAGLMIRETLAAGSRHASVFATPTAVKGVAFQRRTTTNGASVHTAGPSTAPPVWLRLQRTGDQVHADYRLSDTGAWIALGSQTLAGLSGVVHVGLAVSSHVDGRRATATFDNVKIVEADRS